MDHERNRQTDIQTGLLSQYRAIHYSASRGNKWCKMQDTWWLATITAHREPCFRYETDWSQKASNIGLMSNTCVRILSSHQFARQTMLLLLGHIAVLHT